jgi:hypothetical protein
VSLLTSVIAGSGGGGAITTGSIDTTGATLLVAVVAIERDNGVRDVLSDSKSNTWFLLGGQTPASSAAGLLIFGSVATSVGSGHTFTATPSGTGFPSICAMAFDGSNVPPGVFARTASGTSLGVTGTGLTGATTLVIAAVAANNGTSFSVGDGFTIAQQITNLGFNYAQCAAYKYVSSGTPSPTFTWTGAYQATAGAVAFLSPSAGGGGETAYPFA